MTRWSTGLFDLREGEARPVVQSFVVLFLIIAAHTMLETARDALFLTQLPPRQLNLVYVAVAGLSLVVSAASTRLSAYFGQRNALIATLGLAAVTTGLLHSMPLTPHVVMALYVFSGLVGAVLSPQFWLLASQIFTTAQARRLFAPIGAGGVLGGVAGAGSAALLLSHIPVTGLVLVSAITFLATALLLSTFFVSESRARPVEIEPVEESTERTTKPPSMRPPSSEKSYVLRVALLVGLSTAAVLTIDFLFKSTAARTVAPERLGEFFARYYALMNGLSLMVQLLVAGRLVRRLGVAGATAVTPSLLLVGGVASLVSGGAVFPIFATRMADGSLRYSLNRVATELLYLPMPTAVRERAKALIDTFFARAVQAATAALLFGLGTAGILSRHVLGGIVVTFCGAWVGVAFGMRARYLDLFRRSLAGGTLQLDPESAEIDLNAAEALVEAMASPDTTQVVAALDVLDHRSRTKLIPALILYHESDAVLLRALEIFRDSPRQDWVPLGERLLSHPREAVRVAAVRALAKHGVASALARAMEDVSSAVQAYAAYHLALRSDEADLTEHPLLAVMLKAPGDFGDAARNVLLAAIADAPDPRAAGLVLAIATASNFRRSEESVTLVGHAMRAVRDLRYIPYCIDQLAMRPGREAIRLALVAMGAPALLALEHARVDPQTSRRVRAHIPRSIARFGTQQACDLLMNALETERDGFVRYKVLRGLGHLVAFADVRVDRRRIEAQMRANLIEHLRATAYRVGVERDTAGPVPPSEDLLVGLLGDKQSQSLERAFRLLKIAHRKEDIHRVHVAAMSADRRVRSNAGEFLDSLLSGASRRDLRELFRLVVDDLEPAQRVARAAAYLPSTPTDRDHVLAALVEDRDEAVATIASYYALSLGGETLRASVERARKGRPSLDSLLERFFGGAPLPGAAE